MASELEKAEPQLLSLFPSRTSPAAAAAAAAAEDKQSNVVERRAANELSYNDFFWQYMKPNWPVIITNVSNDWPCRRYWVIADDAGYDAKDNDRNANLDTATPYINFDYLRTCIGDCLVPVADCNETYFNSHAKLELKFYDFLARWQCNIKNDRQSQLEHELNGNQLNSSEVGKENFYLKDWHLASQIPTYDFYKVPKYFASDWLNEQLVALSRDDYRFVYMGPKHSWTSFHADVFGSYSWSTNIVGHKKWLIMPPGEELKLADRLGNLPFSIDEQQLKQHDVHFFTIHQRANEAIFVPSGWFHQVWNESATISVNHNWFNACNAPQVWKNLQANMKAVYFEIEDCRQMDNFTAHCQTMLRASFGINYLDFIELLEFITVRRLIQLKDESDAKNILLFKSFKMNNYHVRYDIVCLQQLLTAMLEDEIVQQSPLELYTRCANLLQQITQACQNEACNTEA